MIQFTIESTALLTARVAYGDRAVGEWLSNQEYDHEFAGRHSNQLSSCVRAVIDAETP